MIENEPVIRLSIFAGFFCLFALIETLRPGRARKVSRTRRWSTNLAILVLDSLSLKVLPFLAVAAAIDAGMNGWGLFNLMDLPVWIEFILAVLILDLAIWTQHLVTHKVPVLWRLHRVHHADRDFDVTTALRFHPLEILFSMVLKIGLVYLLGPAAVAVLVFEVILNATAMFNHMNTRLPLGLDKYLRMILVTPDMHRVHHSIHREEHDSNYGFALSIWDRIFRTYVAQPRDGHDEMTIGLEWQDKRPTELGWSLIMPFLRK